MLRAGRTFRPLWAPSSLRLSSAEPDCALATVPAIRRRTGDSTCACRWRSRLSPGPIDLRTTRLDWLGSGQLRELGAGIERPQVLRRRDRRVSTRLTVCARAQRRRLGYRRSLLTIRGGRLRSGRRDGRRPSVATTRSPSQRLPGRTRRTSTVCTRPDERDDTCGIRPMAASKSGRDRRRHAWRRGPRVDSAPRVTPRRTAMGEEPGDPQFHLDKTSSCARPGGQRVPVQSADLTPAAWVAHDPATSRPPGHPALWRDGASAAFPH